MDDQSPETTSDLYKIVRAIDGDTSFKLRVEVALELLDIERTRKNLLHVAKAVVDNIFCTVEGTVDTSAVTDEQIMAAIESLS